MPNTSQPIFHWPTGAFLEASPSSRTLTCSHSDVNTVHAAQVENRQKKPSLAAQFLQVWCSSWVDRDGKLFKSGQGCPQRLPWMGSSFSSSTAQALLAQWAECGARPHCSGSLAGDFQHSGESCFFLLWVPQSHLSFGKQPQLWERVQFTSQRTESQEADFTFRILREGPIEFIPFCQPDPLLSSFFPFDCFSCFRS